MYNQTQYWQVNREERFYAALLFSTLLSNRTNLGIFLNYLSDIQKLPSCNIDQCELYYEYTYLRDMWFNIGRKNDEKKEMILSFLNLTNSNELRKMSVPEFNAFFGTSRPSNDDIMSPGTWSIPKYSSHISNDVEFEKTCMFKWSFNAKPDLVIHLDKNNIVCIEAKLESGEGQYPSSQKDRDIFLKRLKNLISQTDLQKYMFENILKLKQFPFFLLKARTGQPRCEITWIEVFNKLSIEHMHPFIKKGIDTLKNISNSNNISDESDEI